MLQTNRLGFFGFFYMILLRPQYFFCAVRYKFVDCSLCVSVHVNEILQS